MPVVPSRDDDDHGVFVFLLTVQADSAIVLVASKYWMRYLLRVLLFWAKK
jgi:hypothetical protein